jgi:hypothetical protein
VKYTNKYGLPEAFVRAVVNDPYSKGESDFSATGLANPPRASALIEKFYDQIEVDVTSRVAAIIGQGSHSIAERAARPNIDICEKRFFAKIEVDGETYTISAQVDLFETDSHTLHDWKTTKAYAFSKKAGSGKKPEWIEQLNIGAWILSKQPEQYIVKKLSIIAMLKDWSKREAGSAGMPESEVLAVELPMWAPDVTEAHIKARVRAHVAARKELPTCGPKEHWGGNRCGQWCDASSVCEQYKDSLKSGLINKKAEGE